MVAATLVEGKEMLQTVIFSVAAGLGVTFAFSVAIWGYGRYVELSRDGNRLQAGGAAAVAGLGLAVVVLAVVFGILVMTGK